MENMNYPNFDPSFNPNYNQNVNPNYIMPPQPAPVKKRFALNTSDRVFAFAVIVLCVLLVSNGIFKGLYFGFTLFFTVIFAAISLYLFKKNTKPGIFEILCGALAFAGGIVYTVSTNVIVLFLLVPVLFILCVVWFSALAGVKAPAGDLGLPALIWKHGIRDSVVNVPVSLGSIAAGENGGKRKWIKALIGVLCALPVAFIVVTLLINADQAFFGLVSGITERIGEYIFYFVAGLIISLFAVAFCFSLKKSPDNKPDTADTSKIDGVYVTAFLSLLSVCYLAYLFSQFSYFFDAFKNMLPVDFSYAEYARKGFFELCAVSVINLAVIFCSLIFTVKKEKKLPVPVKALCLFVSVFTLLLCATSFAKTGMYINTYGLTVARVVSFAFTVFLVSVFIVLIVRLFSCKVKVLHTAVISASVILVVLGLVNVDKLVCEFNYNAYMSGKTSAVDMWTLSDAGASGVPFLEKLTHCDDEITAKRAVWHLKRKEVEMYCFDENGNVIISKNNRWNSGIFAYNVSLNKAYEILENFDFSGYDLNELENYIIWSDDNTVFVDKEEAIEEESIKLTEEIFDTDNFLFYEYYLDLIVGAVRRNIETGSLKPGDELEFYGGTAASLNLVKSDDSLLPLNVSVNEKDALINIAAVAPKMYKIKIFSNSIHLYCEEASGIDDRLVFTFDGCEPSSTIEWDGDIYSFSNENLEGSWYKLLFMTTEKIN